MAYNDKALDFINEIKSFAARGFVASVVQPSIKTEGSIYKYVLLMERNNTSKGEI